MLVLTDEQAEQFLSQGFVKIEGCFEKAAIQDWIELSCRTSRFAGARCRAVGLSDYERTRVDPA